MIFKHCAVVWKADYPWSSCRKPPFVLCHNPSHKDWTGLHGISETKEREKKGLFCFAAVFFSCSLSLCIRSCVCKTIMLCQNEFTSKIKFRSFLFMFIRVRPLQKIDSSKAGTTQWIFSRSLWDEVQVTSTTTVGNILKNNWTVKKNISLQVSKQPFLFAQHFNNLIGFGPTYLKNHILEFSAFLCAQI